MKLSAILLGMFFVTSAFAFPYEVECTGKYNGQKIKATVEQNFGGGRFDYQRAEVTVDGVVSKYEVRGGPFGLYSYSYDNDGISLRVDLWPDSRPQWGSQYDGTLIVDVLDNARVRNLRCRFPNVM